MTMRWRVRWWRVGAVLSSLLAAGCAVATATAAQSLSEAAAGAPMDAVLRGVAYLLVALAGFVGALTLSVKAWRAPRTAPSRNEIETRDGIARLESQVLALGVLPNAVYRLTEEIGRLTESTKEHTAQLRDHEAASAARWNTELQRRLQNAELRRATD